MTKVSVTNRKADGVIEVAVSLGASFNIELAEQFIKTLSEEKASQLVTKFNGLVVTVLPTDSAQDILDKYCISCYQTSMEFRASETYLAEEIANLKQQSECQGEVNKLYANIESLRSGRDWIHWLYNVYLVISKSPKALQLNDYKVNHYLHLVHDEDATIMALLNRMKAFCKNNLFDVGLNSMAEDFKNYSNTPKFQ
ncbi:hypothetical protein KFS98_003754 [Salmonella enterica]|nr:hypothetical protein [Salmonella enterica]